MTDRAIVKDWPGDPVSTVATLLTVGGNTLAVATGQGARFASPAAGEYTVITLGTVDAYEVIKVDTRTADSMHISGRGIGGTVAQEWPVGTEIQTGPPALVFNLYLQAADMELHDANALGMAHGITFAQDVATFGDATLVTVGNLKARGGGAGAAVGQYLRASNTDGLAMWQDGEWTEVMTTATRSRSLTALADVTDLTTALLEFSMYKFEAWISFYTAATTTGIQLAMGYPGGVGSVPIHGKITVPLTATTEQIAYFKAVNAGLTTPSVSATGINNPFIAKIEGVIHTSAADALAVRFASEVAGSNVTIVKGSTLRVKYLGIA